MTCRARHGGLVQSSIVVDHQGPVVQNPVGHYPSLVLYDLLNLEHLDWKQPLLSSAARDRTREVYSMR